MTSHLPTSEESPELRIPFGVLELELPQNYFQYAYLYTYIHSYVNCWIFIEFAQFDGDQIFRKDATVKSLVIIASTPYCPSHFVSNFPSISNIFHSFIKYCIVH